MSNHAVIGYIFRHWWRHRYCLFSLRCHFSQSTERIMWLPRWNQPISNVQMKFDAFSIENCHEKCGRPSAAEIQKSMTISGNGFHFQPFLFPNLSVVAFHFNAIILDLNTILTGLVDFKPVRSKYSLSVCVCVCVFVLFCSSINLAIDVHILCMAKYDENN